MWASSLVRRSLGVFHLVSSIACTPLLFSLLGSDSALVDQPESVSSPAGPDTSHSRLVVAHFMVGNTYSYQMSDWETQIGRASDAGFDAFSLNVGSDQWQAGQVQSAFEAAEAAGSNFKLFMSFDMNEIPCSSEANANLLQTYLANFTHSPSYLLFRERPLVSTFSGHSCTFGQASPDQGWVFAIKQSSPEPYFVPSFFVDPVQFSDYAVMDGNFNWNAAWPMGDYDVDFSSDEAWIENLGNGTYMASVSPWFFTHYSSQDSNKNFIYRMDDWMFTKRWELLIDHYDEVPIVQVVSWNDWGESHYLGPLLEHEEQPNSQAWVNGFDHQGWLDLFAYYIQAFKTNRSYTAVTRDRLVLWARLHPAEANASDPIGPPANREWTQDILWAIAMLETPADVTLECGSTRKTWSGLPSGLSNISIPLIGDCSVKASIRRGDNSMVFLPPGFEFSTTNISTYNFNAFVAAS